MLKIINFHDVHDMNWFEQIILLLKSKYKIVSIKDLESYYYDKKILKNSCHITFDDGDRYFYSTIYPILKKHEIPASLFVSPKICIEDGNFWFQEIEGFNQKYFKKILSEVTNIDYKTISKYSMFLVLKNLKIADIWKVINTYRNKYSLEAKEGINLNIGNLIEIDRDGLVVIGAHTLNHPILANEVDATSEKEINDSILGLAEILGHDVRYFAFPNGLPGLDFNARELDYLRNNNCRIAFSTVPRDFSLNDNPLSIPRYGISNLENAYYFRIKLLAGDYWGVLSEAKLNSDLKIRHLLKKEMKLSLYKASNS